MKFTGKPVIIEGRLALNEINPLGNEPEDISDLGLFTQTMRIKHREWIKAESALRTLFVNLLAFDKIGDNYFLPSPRTVLGFTGIHPVVIFDRTYTADIDSNNELINLEII